MKKKLFFIILCILIFFVCCNTTQIEENYGFYSKNYDGTYELKKINTSNLPSDLLPRYKKYILSNSNELIVSYDPFGNIYCIDKIKNSLIQKTIYFSANSKPLVVILYEYKKSKLKKRIIETLDYGIKEEIDNDEYSLDLWTRRLNIKNQKKEKFGIKFIKENDKNDYFQMKGNFGFLNQEDMEIIYSEKKYKDELKENGIKKTSQFINLKNNLEVLYIVDEYVNNKNENYKVITDQVSSNEINKFFEKNTIDSSVLGKVVNDDNFIEISTFKKKEINGVKIIYNKKDELKINQIIFPDLSLSYLKDTIYITINIDIQEKPIYLVNYIPTEKIDFRLGKYSISDKKYKKSDLFKKAIDKDNDKYYFFIKQSDLENLKDNKIIK